MRRNSASEGNLEPKSRNPVDHGTSECLVIDQATGDRQLMDVAAAALLMGVCERDLTSALAVDRTCISMDYIVLDTELAEEL
jgi:hypothetical protein